PPFGGPFSSDKADRLADLSSAGAALIDDPVVRGARLAGIAEASRIAAPGRTYGPIFAGAGRGTLAFRAWTWRPLRPFTRARTGRPLFPFARNRRPVAAAPLATTAIAAALAGMGDAEAGAVGLASIGEG